MNTITNSTQHLEKPALAVSFLSVAAVTPGASMINHQRTISRYAGKHIRVHIVKEFVEIGPATDWRKRPILTEMLEYLREHPKILHAIFPGPHRFSRSHADTLQLREQFDAMGVNVVFSDQPAANTSLSPRETKTMLATLVDLLEGRTIFKARR